MSVNVLTDREEQGVLTEKARMWHKWLTLERYLEKSFGQQVIAIDFDGTICEDAWPKVGSPYKFAVNAMKRMREEGHVIIIHTCREGKQLQDALAALRDWGAPWDYANENVPARCREFGGDCRKISADYYLDDKGV